MNGRRLVGYHEEAVENEENVVLEFTLTHKRYTVGRVKVDEYRVIMVMDENCDIWYELYLRKTKRGRWKQMDRCSLEEYIHGGWLRDGTILVIMNREGEMVPVKEIHDKGYVGEYHKNYKQKGEENE